MGSFSLMHWVIVLAVVVLLFGGGRISSVMGDVAKGIKSFKKGMADDDDDTAPVRKATPVQQIEAKSDVAPQPAATVSSEHKQG